VRKGEETSTLSYLLPKLHEEEMALPSDEEPAERKLPEQPALAAFVMPDAPPAPAQEEPARAGYRCACRIRTEGGSAGAAWPGCPLLQRAEKYVLQRGRD
jgi:ribonuclease E